MPLRDHFRPPFTDISSWEEVHGQWPAVIVQQLGRLLPPEYSAGPRVHLGAQVEVDVAAYEKERPTTAAPMAPPNHGATAVWAPEKPTLSVQTDLSDYDEYEVRIYDTRAGRKLVAAIELISPANKDRPERRSQFVAKCASLLRADVSLILVDVITVRRFNLYAELLNLIGEQDISLGAEPPATYAVACRWTPRGASRWLDAWRYDLNVGERLPCLPLWLNDELAIPLDLETGYEQTCRDLRIV